MRAVKERGLLRRRPGDYAWKLALNATLFVLGWVAFALVGASWWNLLTGAFFALVYAQLAFLGHDAGHKQVFAGRRANDVAGYLLGALVGMSFAWWVSKHNRHHAYPNHEEDDPDLDIAVLAFTEQQAADKRGFSRWMTKYQAFLFFPLLLLEGLSLHNSSAVAVLRGRVKARRLEAVLLAAHFAGYLAAVFLVLTPLQALAFIAVHQGLWGLYMGCSFAPNHKGMPTLKAGEKLDHLRKQVLTSRNVRGGRITDFALGGLNYQIEHHLFPSMPRANLRRAQPLVEDFCRRLGLPYHQSSAFSSYLQVLRHLHAVSAPLRAKSITERLG
ncbi:acyl-CoA desaturase [Amycolatopsis cynarae]|uniref:Acyl-CoA desaturase n=2 Tax=Amycolatopsis cynarae TaxID=2995223 RepID=A0ABY7BBR2_9PSEU|nr:acyl-CoA desaturase [Amycolatopsis sp. HUAS 11-8]WAL69806.1 acyl-CoA desaturase [Amycolatopsis sp. HUAS 11-8]